MQAFEKMLHSCLRDCFFLDVCKQDSFWLNQSWPESSSSLAWASQFLQRDCRALREKFKRCFDRRNHRKDQRVHEDFTREGAKWPAHISQINSYFQGFLFYPYFTYSHCPIYFNTFHFNILYVFMTSYGWSKLSHPAPAEADSKLSWGLISFAITSCNSFCWVPTAKTDFLLMVSLIQIIEIGKQHYVGENLVAHARADGSGFGPVSKLRRVTR